MGLADEGEANGEQWFHLSKNPIELHAYRATRERDEPVAFIWEGWPRARDLAHFMHRAETASAKTTVYAFADEGQVAMSLSKWRLQNFKNPLPGLKFLRFELFENPDSSIDAKPDLAVWAPITLSQKGTPIESDIGALVSPFKAPFALHELAELITETSIVRDVDVQSVYASLRHFFDNLHFMRNPNA